ncbi:hypothetical protein FDECE_16546 [Fusarium decemcellulare]|nr:hypothetical protein FDECE_16546 [Fusarium decemcellulare]
MHSSLVFASAFLAIFQSWVSAMAISNLPRDFRVGAPGVVHYDGNVTKRDDVPDRCWVSTIGKGIYLYVPFHAGDENYVYDYVEDIITAGQDQIAKDGGGKRSSKGVFEAKWEGYTTAVPDRGPMQATLDAYFRFSLPNCDAAPQACSHQNRHYYYNFKGESIGIVHKDGDCGGFLGIGGDPLEYCPGQGHCKN